MSNNILLSDLFRLNVRCDQGIDHGYGIMAWMHPPVHRILGWISRPSSFNLSRVVWRLDQLKGMTTNQAYVKGIPSMSDQETLDRFPTLINANVLNKNGDKLASIVDLYFNYKTGKISYYLISRSNPKIPGSSRWSLKIDQIKDQQPGMILSNLFTLDDLPLIKASFKEEFLQKSKGLKDQIKDIKDKASGKLEGWLEEKPWEENLTSFSQNNYESNNYNSWIDNNERNNETQDKYEQLGSSRDYYENLQKDNDPWI